MLRVLTLNIGRPSAQRAKQLIGWLNAHPADVTVLTEFSDSPGSALLRQTYENAGYHVSVSSPDTPKRGVAIITAAAPVDVRHSELLGERALSVIVDTAVGPVDVVGVYAPSSDPSASVTGESLDRKRTWLDAFYQVLSYSDPQTMRIVAGDLNIADPRKITAPDWLADFERRFFTNMERLGLYDLSPLGPTDLEFSWIGRGEQQLRFDYVLASQHFPPLVDRHEYIHDVRESKLADHSALFVDLRIEKSDSVERDELKIPGEQLSIF
ncbi:exonuclease III [Corynebacterium mustelae]|uniref:Exonuclease III n=1 Tax=Corynebacterium mustelae TaxID=571915 RepID=A0A0G3GW59_9CORY|nr:endonuclease/exonuclease/phosphatase family protein [Corynebacterium mustelae]AKK04745.1 exonuclease III [Corynebacterium mustelae]